MTETPVVDDPLDCWEKGVPLVLVGVHAKNGGKKAHGGAGRGDRLSLQGGIWRHEAHEGGGMLHDTTSARGVPFPGCPPRRSTKTSRAPLLTKNTVATNSPSDGAC